MGVYPGSCGYTWPGYRHWTAQASGAATVVTAVVWMMMTYCWCVIVKCVGELIT